MASPSGTTSGTRGATASSPTAFSTTRSRRSWGSGCSPWQPSRRRRSPSRSCSGANGDRARAGRVARSPSSGPGSCSRRRSPSPWARHSHCSRSGRSRPGARPLRAAGRAYARREPARVPAAGAAPRRLRDRALARSPCAARPRAHDRRLRGGRGAGRAGVPRSGPLPLLVAGTGGGADLLRPWRRVDVAGRAGERNALDLRRVPRRLRGLLPDPFGDRGKRRPPPLRGRAAGGPDALAAPVAAAARVPRRSVPRDLVEPVSDRGQRHQGQPDPAESAAYWTPAITFLRAHLSPSYRVEAVDTTGHWPAVYLAEAEIPLARGDYRQSDFPQNALLYDELGPATYLPGCTGSGCATWSSRRRRRTTAPAPRPPSYAAVTRDCCRSSAPRISPSWKCRTRSRS